MQKSTGRRGRPATNPYIEGIIIMRTRAEELEPPGRRMLPKVLAAVIQEQIVAEIRNNQKLKGERPPKLSTIEKKVLRYRKLGPSGEDTPWSLASLADERHQIPAEALSTILKLWIWMLDEEGFIMSVREAKWAARFYAAINEGAASWNAINEGAANVVNPLQMLSLYARAYATSELIAEILGNPFDMGASFDSTLWTLLTGKRESQELTEKIYRRPQPEIQFRTTEKEWARSKQLNEWLPYPANLALWLATCGPVVTTFFLSPLPTVTTVVPLCRTILSLTVDLLGVCDST